MATGLADLLETEPTPLLLVARIWTTYVALLVSSPIVIGLEVTVFQVAPPSMEYSTLVIAEPFELPSVYWTFSVRLSDVLMAPITGGLGALIVVTARAPLGLRISA